MSRKKQIQVQVGRVGTTLKTIKVDEDATVEDALDAVSLHLKNSESVSVNGEDAELDAYVEANDVIMLVRGVAGGR